MQDANREIMRALESKLDALVRCVIKKAQGDPAFAEQLEEILLSDSLRATLQAKKPSTSTKNVFNPVGYLQDHGKERLRRELEEKPNSELTDVVRFHRIVKGKAAKGLDRTTMIDEIVGYAERSLGQGGAFLRDKKRRIEAAETGETDEGPARRKEGEARPKAADGQQEPQPEPPVDASTTGPEVGASSTE